MRILICAAGYYPAKKYGGPVTSMRNLGKLLNDDIYVVCFDHDLGLTRRLDGIADGWNNVEGVSVLYLPDREYNWLHLSQIMDDVSPDIVYIQSLFGWNGTLIALPVARAKHIAVVLAPRGELNHAALSSKSYKKRPFLAMAKWAGLFRRVAFQSTSEEETEAIVRYLGVPRDMVMQVPNVPGPNIASQRTRIKEKGCLKAVFVGRIHPQKNLKHALTAMTEAKQKILFDIFGPAENEAYLSECQAVIESLPSNVHASYRGPLSPEEASTVYLDYDCLVSPTKGENFGHAICESLLSGCPVVISKGTTPWDKVDGVAGFSVPNDDAASLAQRLDQMAQMDESDYQMLCKAAGLFVERQINRRSVANSYKALFELALKVNATR